MFTYEKIPTGLSPGILAEAIDFVTTLVGDSFQIDIGGGTGWMVIPATEDDGATRGSAVGSEGGKLEKACDRVVTCILETLLQRREPGRLDGHDVKPTEQ